MVFNQDLYNLENKEFYLQLIKEWETNKDTNTKKYFTFQNEITDYLFINKFISPYKKEIFSFSIKNNKFLFKKLLNTYTEDIIKILKHIILFF